VHQALRSFRAAFTGRVFVVFPVASLAVGLMVVNTAVAAPSSRPTVESGFTIRKLVTLPRSATNCDDLAYLDGHLFMTCQNNTGSAGGGGNSKIVELADDGKIINTWSIVDKADGIGADPINHRLIVTLNEDANTHLVTITPGRPAGQQVVNYKYSVDPGSRTLTGPLHTGGGTDAVSVDRMGGIYLSASFGQAKTGTAVFKVALSPPITSTATGTARLSPTFVDDAVAANGNTGTGTVKMNLIDVDSNAIVPYTSPRYAGQFVIDDQTALQLVFSSNTDRGTGLTVLKTPSGLDDIRWATTDGGTLYVVDKGSSDGISSLSKVTGPFVAGTAYASNDSMSDQVDTVNLTNGKLTPFIRNLLTSKGLVFVNATGSVPALSLAQPTTVRPAARRRSAQ
jgi:hypothetical protein